MKPANPTRACAVLAILALLVTATVAQQPPSHATGKPFIFHASSRLVVEAVTVAGKDGRPVAGLTAKDFVVTEDGAPQQVAFCEYQHLAQAPPASAQAAVQSINPGTITPESAAGTRYQNRRLLVFYFDLTAMSEPDQLRALQAAENFVAHKLQPSDLVALLAYEGAAVKVKQDFTGNRGQLERAIARLVYVDVLGYDSNPSDADTADTGSAFGQDDSEFNIFNTNRQLAALHTAIDMLAPISERKALIYFSSGMRLNGLDNQAQLQATEDAAIRDNVALFPIDASGLQASAPLGNASQGSPGGASMYNGEAANALQMRRENAHDTLYALGADTGGKALLNTNDIGSGITQAEAAISSYYLIGYYTTHPQRDGRYRRVRVRLRPPLTASLAYRTGYYMTKSFAKFTAADKERQLEDALMLPDPITQLTIALEVNWFELDSANYFVPIAAKIPGSELALAKAGGAKKSLIDLIGEVKDQYGTTITNLRDRITMKLSGKTAQELARSPVEFTAGFTLLPGRYSLKLLARDAETGRIGTYLAHFTIPNVPSETRRLPLSTVVLSHQSLPMRAALYNVKKVMKQATERANPLIQNGEELLPSVTRVFSRRQTMELYAQAYERGRTTASPLLVYVAFYQQGREVLQTQPARLTAAVHPPAWAVPIRLRLPLEQLKPGRYTCQVTVLDPGGSKAAFWRARVWIVR